MKYTKNFIKISSVLLFSFSISLCCDTTLSTPTARGRCEELLRENEKRQKDLADKYEVVKKSTPKETLPIEEKKVLQESENLARDYAKRIQDLHLD